jgi:hypothetical protein
LFWEPNANVYEFWQIIVEADASDASEYGARVQEFEDSNFGAYLQHVCGKEVTLALLYDGLCGAGYPEKLATDMMWSLLNSWPDDVDPVSHSPTLSLSLCLAPSLGLILCLVCMCSGRSNC